MVRLRRFSFPLLLLLSTLIGACRNQPAPFSVTVTPAASPGSATLLRLEDNVQTLVHLELSTLQTTTLFTVPDNGWLADFAAGPQGDNLVLSYAPPPPAGEIQFGYTALYQFIPEADAPWLRLLPPDPAGAHNAARPAEMEGELFFDPAWAPDGHALYFSRVRPLDPEGFTYATTLERLDPATGEVSVLAEDGIWAVAAADGRTLAYVQVDPQTQAHALYLLDLPSGESQQLVREGLFTAIDAPFFSADGAALYFSAVSANVAAVSSPLPWWQRLLGVQTTQAHDLPSDWWRVAAGGGEPVRLTTEAAVGLFGQLTGEGDILYVQRHGLFRMAPDGSNVRPVWSAALLDSLAWQP